MFDNIQFDKSAVFLFWISDSQQFKFMESVHVSDLSEPVLQWRSMILILNRSADATTIVVPTYNDVFLMQTGELQEAGRPGEVQ